MTHSPSTAPATAAWLEPLEIERDDASWTYWLPSSGHWFPVSITGVISRVCKSDDALLWIEAWRSIWEPRGNTCHAALQHFAHHRWSGPAALQPEGADWDRPLDPLEPTYGAYSDWIKPLLAQPIWEHVEVVASELMLYDLERNVAGTLDLILRFPDGSYGVADLKSLSEKGRKYDTRPQLGAGVVMAQLHYGLPFSRCLTIWAGPGQCEIQTHRAEDCADRWLRAFCRYEAAWRPW
ncbi:hypothetical protein KBZ18_10015 [Synechococcus sp. Cruz-9H2]|uniref:PD-(D/E)XK nuclease family protein n=1 Tax=unclassified Synechococcus TaxID=2626047 RepID=UPI0020CBF54B|nr:MULTISPECIES: PD-(D/E)XK nuclease family protein [unclassified Synechococcus]MCP9819827.1 hypothetical protein [Synechococcus sp. Cruz-9H2]MCP9844107.1 hypothetical protein [Synechococcus sp. Edmonson 11F2]MCP9856257.1 hypothetical protein [Synechococcus sp. Cruz-9C9]MCP9863542.1 hypothetical protein [Synechococcus sp. Cruz-7E5]MCP9870738.1 hypothetical protein [Synechococcus sp. Cruz-7B9]